MTRTAAWGARVVLHGETLAESAAHAADLAETEGRVSIHPYDDPAVIAGQGTLALELLADFPDLDALIVPVGGGGLLAGCAIAAPRAAPRHRGVRRRGRSLRADGAAPRGQPVEVGGATIAEGIAVRDVGELPLAMIRDFGLEVLVVPELAIEEAIGLLAEGAKVVAEGAGAAGVAALLTYPDRFRGKRVGIAICGGNIDARILVQRAGAQPAARRAPAAPAPADPRPSRRAGRHRRRASAVAAETSSRFRTSACSPPPPCRPPNWR